MTQEEFVTYIQKDLGESYIHYLRDNFEAKWDPLPANPMWKTMIPIYQSLNRQQRDDFLKFIRSTAFDGASIVIAVIDGTSIPHTTGEEFKIITSDGDDLTEFLSDSYLAKIEETYGQDRCRDI